jgi:lipopolysaccharide biosynthesis protein
MIGAIGAELAVASDECFCKYWNEVVKYNEYEIHMSLTVL